MQALTSRLRGAPCGARAISLNFAGTCPSRNGTFRPGTVQGSTLRTAMPGSVLLGEQRETMPLVIWRLPHPVRGIVAFLGIFIAGSMLGGFGVGIPELAVLGLLAAGVALVVATRTTGDDRSSS
jgi:hypothetical protein